MAVVQTVDEKMKDMIARMTLKNNYWGYLFSRIRRKPNNSLPSIMGVAPEPDGTLSLLYHPELVKHTDEENLMHVVEHEGMHVLNKHVSRLLRIISNEVDEKKKGEKLRVWGIAADCAANQQMRIPKVLKIAGDDWPACYPENFKLEDGKSTEWYYYHLLENPEKMPPQPKIKICNGKCGQGEGQPGEGQSGQCNCPGSGQGQEGFDDHDGWAHGAGKVADISSLSRKVDNYVQDIIKDSLKNFSKQRGNLPGHIAELIQEALAPPKAPYYEIIRKLVRGSRLTKFRRSPTRINRKRSYAFFLNDDKDDKSPIISPFPGKTRDFSFNITIMIDTSGSMSIDDIKEGLSSIKNIIENDKHCKVTVLEVDTHIQKEYTIKKLSDIQFNIAGRGGTVLIDGLERCRELASDITLVFTDGYCDNINGVNRRSIPKKIVYVIQKDGTAEYVDRTGFIVRI